jgi:hypothetical protein
LTLQKNPASSFFGDPLSSLSSFFLLSGQKL